MLLQYRLHLEYENCKVAQIYVSIGVSKLIDCRTIHFRQLETFRGPRREDFRKPSASPVNLEFDGTAIPAGTPDELLLEKVNSSLRRTAEISLSYIETFHRGGTYSRLPHTGHTISLLEFTRNSILVYISQLRGIRAISTPSFQTVLSAGRDKTRCNFKLLKGYSAPRMAAGLLSAM